MPTFKEGTQKECIKKNVYYAYSVPHEESYDVHECIGCSVVVISIKNDRNNIISRRVASGCQSVPTNVVLPIHVSPLRTTSLVKLRY